MTSYISYEFPEICLWFFKKCICHVTPLFKAFDVSCQLSKVQTPYPDIFEAFGSQMGLKVIDSHVMADNPQWPNETAGQSD